MLNNKELRNKCYLLITKNNVRKVNGKSTRVIKRKEIVLIITFINIL